MSPLDPASAPFYPTHVPPSPEQVRDLRALGGSIQEAHALLRHHPGASTRLVVATHLMAAILTHRYEADSSRGVGGYELARRAVSLADSLIKAAAHE